MSKLSGSNRSEADVDDIDGGNWEDENDTGSNPDVGYQPDQRHRQNTNDLNRWR